MNSRLAGQDANFESGYNYDTGIKEQLIDDKKEKGYDATVETPDSKIVLKEKK